MARPPLDVSYLDAAPGRWKWVTWPLFALAGLVYLGLAGFTGELLMRRFGIVPGSVGYVVFLGVAILVFKAGMKARRKR